MDVAFVITTTQHVEQFQDVKLEQIVVSPGLVGSLTHQQSLS
jgi:hypothetical protein